MASKSTKRVSVGLIGPGLIGRTLLQQLDETRSSLSAENLEIDVVAVCNSKKMSLNSTVRCWQVSCALVYSFPRCPSTLSHPIPLTHSIP